MKKPLFLLPFFAILLLCSFLIKGDDNKGKIIWSADRPLTWKDFKVTQPAKAAFSALTHWEIQFSSSVVGDSLTTTTECYFDPSQSSVKKDCRTDTFLLGHEQFHFNIAALYTRKFRKALSELVITKKEVASKVPKLYSKYVADCSKEQDRYDNETQHSLKKDEQLKWQADIQQQLTALDAYNNAAVNIYVK